MFEPLPWTVFKDDKIHFWVHYGLCILGLMLALASLITQLLKPAPYGRHATQDAQWGPKINQKCAHTLSDGPPGVILFVLVFFLYGIQRGYANIVFLVLWLCHYVHRGFIHPWIMNYGSSTTPIGIPIAGFFPNVLFSYLNADWIGAAQYTDTYYYDPRFIIGIVLFITGFVINRWADWTLKNLRSKQPEESSQDYKGKYFIPMGFLFNIITCPNYFGEMLEWCGWAITTWSVAGVVWLLFGCATFFPRAKQHQKWYREKFENYPVERKALVPFIY